MTAEELKVEVQFWSDRIRVDLKEIHVREMKRKWASCSSSGRLTFNKELLHKSRKFVNEVIVHELLHLKYPNHGRMFKTLMKAYLGKNGDR